jgi:hypothetical protein
LHSFNAPLCFVRLRDIGLKSEGDTSGRINFSKKPFRSLLVVSIHYGDLCAFRCQRFDDRSADSPATSSH